MFIIILVGSDHLPVVIQPDEQLVKGAAEQDLFDGPCKERLLFRRGLLVFSGHHQELGPDGQQVAVIAGYREKVVLADEAGSEPAPGILVDLLRRIVLLDAAAVHNDDPVAHGEGLFLVVGDIDEGDAQPLLQAPQFHLHGLPQLVVQGTQWFVQQQDFRIVYQRPGDGYPLLLAATHLLGLPVTQLLQLGQLQHFGNPFLLLLAGNFFHQQPEADVFFHCHMGEQGIMLEHHVHIALVGGQLGDFFVIQKNMTRSGRLQTGNHAQYCGLATAGRPQQGHEFSVVDSQIKGGDNQVVFKLLGDPHQTNHFFHL